MRAIIRRWEVWLCGLAMLVIAGYVVFAQMDGEAGVAVVSVRGERVCAIDLGREPDGFLSLQEEWGVPVLLEVRGHKIRYAEVRCPDHICEQAGLIWKPGQSAVCMPNRVIVTIE